MAPLTFIIAGVLSAIVICAFGWFMPAHTEQGTRALEGVLGFEDFLNHVESDRFNRMIKTPQMFEKFLPFAMALGVEKNWSKAFQGIMTQPPGLVSRLVRPEFLPHDVHQRPQQHVLARQQRHGFRSAQLRRLRLWWRRLFRRRLRRRWRRRLLESIPEK